MPTKRPISRKKKPSTSGRPRGCLRVFMVMGVALGGIVVIALIATFGVHAWVMLSTQGDIETIEEAVATEDEFDAQCIVVMGAGINYDGSPSAILRDRLDTAIALYKQGVAPKIIMSGDNSERTYNEVMAMCNYAISQGVPAADIFCDHAGVNTYDTMYRVKTVFGVERFIVVTQRYHLYRAIYVAKGLGMQCRGVPADYHEYARLSEYEQREFFARIKDFYQVILKPNAATTSTPVSLDQSGEVTQWW